jgi:hypothetical protein
MPSEGREEQRQQAETAREQAEIQRRGAEDARHVAVEVRQAMEDIRVVREKMRESAELIRQMTEGKMRENEIRFQQVEQLLHLTISEFQEALVQQWKVTNEATTSAQKILQTAERLLQATQANHQ